MTAVQCDVEIPSVQGLADQELTVGREFILVCEGEFPRDLNLDKLHVVLSPQEKYQLKLLSFEFRKANQAELKVTSHKAGDFKFPDLKISDGTETISLGSVNFQVQSVLPPQSPGQPAAKQEPYGPVGPASLAVPGLYWALLAGALALILLTFMSKIYRFIQRRNTLERLKQHDSPMTPLAQFHQNLRRLQRSKAVFYGASYAVEEVQESMTEIDKMFRLFLTRQFQMPAFEWSDRLILQELKKYHRKIYVEQGPDLKKLLRELRRALQDKNKLQATDLLNLAQSTRVLAEKMERSL